MMFDFGIVKLKPISVYQIQITMRPMQFDTWRFINPLVLRSGGYFSKEAIPWEWSEFYK